MTFPVAAQPQTDLLAAYRWKARVLVVVASDAADPRLATQRRLYEAMRQGAEERDLVLVERSGPGPEAVALRHRFAIGEGFRVLLVGKDGTRKLSSGSPLGSSDLFPLIDGMPMRQEEAKQRP